MEGLVENHIIGQGNDITNSLETITSERKKSVDFVNQFYNLMIHYRNGIKV